MKSFSTFIIIIFLAVLASANNISITNVTLTGQNTSAGVNNAANFTLIQFNVIWENSWRTNLGPANWDAAWVFVKYRVNGAGDWHHANLNNTGHTAPGGSIIDVGLLTPGAVFNNTTNPGIGAFIYRTSGNGTFFLTNVQLRWNYGAQGLPDNFPIEVQVFGIEMVYVPTGAFNVGGGGGTNAFTSTTINSGIATTAPSGSGSLGGQAGGYPTGETAPANATWPNGFPAFYCMKYEISQQQYVDFLNCLTRTQQISHVETIITGTTPSFRYVMTNSAVVTERNSIRCDASIPADPAPVTFYCDLNANGIGGESSDGQWLACNNIDWDDLTAYLDWTGLRPMTELEFEKTCRGNLPAVVGEYAWGTNNATAETGIINGGQNNEIAINAGANAAFNTVGIFGPIRVGSFATATTNRVQSGTGYYGVMELSGNLWERSVTIGVVEGRAFTGLHGDGVINANGDANVAAWPDLSVLGSGLRGGNWNGVSSFMQVSDRVGATLTIIARVAEVGGRGVRTAP